MARRKIIAVGAGILAALGLLVGANVAARNSTPAASQETVVKVVVQRFVFTPTEIVLRTGQPTVLEFQSLDFTHGFNIPDLKIRADLPPGQITRVHLTPLKPGVYDFLCDNFCGAGHEQMNGKIIVKN
ncbi:cupredoxin domain-containing protein [Oryzomicrobium sp.]|uniref:cupredoxin domain-containing protein n=1 Tax=Oryzomicrobium sp. TaxID=1911578 RepID=UPI002FE288E7